MNCESMKNMVLLDQSGELSFWKRRRLTAHLERCEDCRAWKTELLRVTDGVRGVAWEDALDIPASRLRAAWPAAVRRRPGQFTREETWRPALVYATLSVALAVLFVLLARPFHQGVQTAARQALPVETNWDRELDDRIASLGQWMQAAESDWSDVDATESDIDSIALQLLALEGERI